MVTMRRDACGLGAGNHIGQLRRRNREKSRGNDLSVIG